MNKIEILPYRHYSYLEDGSDLGAAELELLDYVRYLLEAMGVAVRVGLSMSNDEESRLLEEQDLIWRDS